MANNIAPASPPAGALRERDGADAADARIARAEQRLAMLQELSELGMAMTRRLARRTPETPDAGPAAAPGPRHDPADSFAKLSRAIRLTVAQETRTDDDLADLRAGGPGRAASGPIDRADREAGDGYDAEDAETFDDDVFVPPSRDDFSRRRDPIGDPMLSAIRAELADVYQDLEGLGAPHQRPIEDEPREAFVNLPAGETAKAIGETRGPHPDRSRWTGEDWAPAPPDAPRHRGRNGWAPEFDQTERRQQ